MRTKILHITKMKGVSGSENHLLTLLSELDKKRFTVYLCVLTEPQHIPLLYEYKQRLERDGVTVFFLKCRRYIDFSVVRKLKRFLEIEQIQLVHTHLIHADLYGTLAAKFAGVRTIISSRHNDDRFRHNPLLIWLNWVLARRHTKLIVISDWIGKFLQDVERIPVEKIIRIHYGLHAEPIAKQANAKYVRREFQIPEDVPVIGTIGRLTAQKGQQYLLQAIKEIRPEFPMLRVVLVGDGELRTELETLARDLGIRENIIFTGYRHDAIKLLSGFDFFVFPSLWEGFGLVLLEAMALKKAIVASRVSAIPESVRAGETGILVPPEEAEPLAEALRTLLYNHELAQKMGTAGYERLQHEFSVTKMVQATTSLYESLLV